MQLDYYRSPGQTGQWERPAAAPISPAVRPRRWNGGLTVLIVFGALIVAMMAGLGVLRILNLAGWSSPLEDWLHSFRFNESGFYVHGPNYYDGDFSDQWDYWEPVEPKDSSTASATTIPRAELVPGVQMILSGQRTGDLSYQAIYEKVIPSIVSIQAYGSGGAFEGTGVIMTADGYIVTNHHIISGCSTAEVMLSDGTWYDVKLVGSDVASDLAVLKVDAQNLSPAEFGDSDLLRVGDVVLAIGNPLGSELFGTMTEGIVSAINRDVTVEGYDMSLIQTTAALNPGNSGGALINSAGQVVGITNMKMMSSYETIEGLGFAIPTVQVREVANALLADGAVKGRPTIGISCLTILPEDEEAFGRDSGVYVSSVTSKGPAEQAGIKPGDIIIAANGQPIESTEDLLLARDEAGIGGQLALTVWRDGGTTVRILTLVDQYELN